MQYQYQPPPYQYQPPPYQSQTWNFEEYQNTILLCILIVICYILFSPSTYYFNGKEFMYVTDDYLINTVLKPYRLPFGKIDTIVKTSWSLFDFLLFTYIEDVKSINLIYKSDSSYIPIGIELGYGSVDSDVPDVSVGFYLDLETSKRLFENGHKFYYGSQKLINYRPSFKSDRKWYNA